MDRTPRQLKILLADDVHMELEIERTFLRRSGFRVLTTDNGKEALNLALTERPDIVILDQVMPGMSGTEVCRALKGRVETRSIPVIITSASQRPGIREHCLNAGADAFVHKSAGRDALMATAAQILGVPERKSARLTVFFAVTGIPGGKESLGKSIDLCEGGMSLETNRPHAVGSSFSLRFLLPGEREETKAAGRVIRVSERGDGCHLLGVEFTQLEEPARKRLNEFIDRSLPTRTSSGLTSN